MEFSFEVKSLFPKRITRVVAGKLTGFIEKKYPYEDHEKHFEIVVNKMGKASAQAQKLRSPITTYRKIVESKHVLYIMTDHEGQWGAVVGILKVGRKRLFLTDFIGLIHEVEPLCVLDFYVHESCQRSGYGKQLFDEMLKAEDVKPCLLAIDRPSHKFISFLKKHYNLKTQVPQANKFVVFDEFFLDCKEVQVRPRTRRFLSPCGLEWVMEDVASPLRGLGIKSEPSSLPTRSASGTLPRVSLQNRSRSGSPLSWVVPHIRRSTPEPDNPPPRRIKKGSGNIENFSPENRLDVPMWRYRSGTPSAQSRRSADKPSPLTLFAIHAPDQSQSRTETDRPPPRPERTRLKFDTIEVDQLEEESRDGDQSDGLRRLSDSQEPTGGGGVQWKSEAERAFPDKAPNLNMRAKKRKASQETTLGAIIEQSSSLGSEHAKYSRHKIKSGGRNPSSPGRNTSNTSERIFGSPSAGNTSTTRDPGRLGGRKNSSTSERIFGSPGAKITTGDPASPGVRRTNSTSERIFGSPSAKNTDSPGARKASNTGERIFGSPDAKNIRRSSATKNMDNSSSVRTTNSTGTRFTDATGARVTSGTRTDS